MYYSLRVVAQGAEVPEGIDMLATSLKTEFWHRDWTYTQPAAGRRVRTPIGVASLETTGVLD
jgi:hypothetical protein